MNQLRVATTKTFTEFAEYYHPHAIWLDRTTCDAINTIVDELNRNFVHLSFDVNERGYPRDLQGWKDAFDSVTEKIPQARALLEARFRGLLGVELTSPKAEH